MGWTGSERNKRLTTFQQACEQEGIKIDRILAHNSKAGVHYIAYPSENPKTPNAIIALTVLTKTVRGEFLTKVVDETMGPCTFGASSKVLDALTEPLNEYAREWREKCRAQKSKMNLRDHVGKVMTLEHPIRFIDTVEETSFKIFTWGRALRFMRMSDMGIVRLTKWCQDAIANGNYGQVSFK